MEKEIENKIIDLYLSGVGSTTIIKLIPNLTKRNILKLLKEKNILKNRLLGHDFYKDFWFDGNSWCGTWVCDVCNSKINFTVKEKKLINRTLKNKKTCKKCSLEKQIGEGNPFFNKKHTEETINKISASKSGVTTSDHMSKPEYRKMFSDMVKERWSNGSLEYTRLKLSFSMKERISNGTMKGYNRSKAEDEIIEFLIKENIEVIPNYIIEGKIFDIFIPKFNLVIEYNGDYWHCNPIKYNFDYFNHKKNKTAKEIWEYDKNKLYLATKNGYSCITIWETDYKKNKKIILERLKLHFK
jgi:hypothetical protein